MQPCGFTVISCSSLNKALTVGAKWEMSPGIAQFTVYYSATTPRPSVWKYAQLFLTRVNLCLCFETVPKQKALILSWRIKGVSFEFIHHLRDESCLKSSSKAV